MVVAVFAYLLVFFLMFPKSIKHFKSVLGSLLKTIRRVGESLLIILTETLKFISFLLETIMGILSSLFGR